MSNAILPEGSEPIPGFPRYRVGRCGSVWSHKPSRAKWMLLKPWPNAQEYLMVSLMLDGVRHAKRVHHIVLTVFVGPRPDGFEGCHRDGERGNNALSNLRWDTHAENVADNERNGKKVFGEKHGCAKLCEADIPVIRAEYAKGGTTYRQIGASRGLPPETIFKIVQRKSWKHVA